MLIVELPAEILVKIMNYMSFNQISLVRLVSRRFNEICASMLNSTFQRLQSHMLSRFQAIKAQMPRRESARRNHPLAKECDIVETLHMRLTLLQMTFGKHIERKHVCFFAGEILDEVQRILYYIKESTSLGRAYKVTDELFDLSTMAMEYFKDHIEPTLPEITFFGAEFLDFTTPSLSFSSPTKRRSQSGNTSILGGGIDSPCSSRASVAGSSCSEPWSTSSNGGTGEDAVNVSNYQGTGSVVSIGGFDGAQQVQPQSNMVLRKRIRRIRQGMKKYNDQMGEVKRELKGCKTKMEAQTKQVHEYSSRLEEYDKKFEENSRKFQTLLTELNKCKTELQYWRSKSTTLLSLPPTCAQCEAPLFPENLSSLADAGLFGKSDDGYGLDAAANDLKALANQGVFPDDIYQNKIESEDNKNVDKPLIEDDLQVQNKSDAAAGPEFSTKVFSQHQSFSPTSSGMSPNGNSSAAIVGRKRRSRDEVVDDISGEPSGTRKSLRGAGVKSTRGKRPKVAVVSNV
jgi:F-box protein 28